MDAPGLRSRLAASTAAFRAVAANADLRRVQLALAASVTADWGFAVALSVYAYRSGGAAAVGLVGLVRMGPAALAAPFASLLGDRHPRRTIMVACLSLRTVILIGGAAIVAADAPSAALYALAALAAVVATAFRPAQAALLPALVETPQELTAANVVASTIESVACFVGPALGGLLLAAAGAAWVFVAAAVLVAGAALAAVRVSVSTVADPSTAHAPPLQAVLAGARTIAASPPLRLIVGLYTAQTFVAGAFGVLVVVVALDLLGAGSASVGLINACLGVGGLLGAAVTFAMVGRGRLAADFGTGLLLWGIPIALIAAVPRTGAVLVLAVVLGVGNTVVDVSGMTLLQRAVPDEVLSRAFGALETLILASIGLGAALEPALVHALGVRGALVATGALLPVLVALAWRSLSAVDAAAAVPAERLALLRAIDLFAPLAPATLEQLAGRLEAVDVEEGAIVVAQGDRGHAFFLAQSGSLAVSVDGAHVRTLEAGGYFGEVSLLRDVPRTATVSALTPATLLRLERELFVAAVSGHAESAAIADAVIGSHLGPMHSGLQPI
jgi:MFS family permease